MTVTVWVDQVSGWAARAGAASLLGGRENNEDFIYLDPDHPFALVLDGMGGQAAGEVASQKGAEVVAGALRHGLDTGAEPRELIGQALRAANEAVVELGRTNPDYRNCGTTIVLALLRLGRVHFSWLGDSPALRVSGGRIEKLTWDHTMRNALVHHGIISEDEARDSLGGNTLWQYLGSAEAKQPIEVRAFEPFHGDRLILATDGVTGVVSEEDILAACQSHPDPQACAEELVNLALARGSRDNCTCAVLAFEWASDGPPPLAPEPPERKWWQFWK